MFIEQNRKGHFRKLWKNIEGMGKMEEIKTGYYVKSIDGLRAFAVLSVIFYHLGFQFMVGGYLGVTVFFVISGYLITNLLMQEYGETGKINLVSFWIRRIRRLLPALFTMLFGVTSYVVFFRSEIMDSLTKDFWAAFFYVSNWWYIFQDQSYFETYQSKNVLMHLWSLAIEEQFYVVWPVLMILLLSLKLGKKKLGLMVISLGLISALWMLIAYNPTVDPSRVYYGTDTRAFSLLFGAGLAIFRLTERKYTSTISALAKKILLGICLLSSVLLLLFCIFLSEFSPFVYYGGMFAVSVLTVILLTTLLHPANTMKKFFEWAPFVWIGKRSYSLYLWHFPIIVLSTPTVHTGGIQWGLIIFQIGLTFILTWLTYRLIENPIRYGYFFKNTKGKVHYAGMVCTPIILAMFGVSVYGMLQPSPVSTTVHQPNASVSNERFPETNIGSTNFNVGNQEPSSASDAIENPSTPTKKAPTGNQLDLNENQVTFIGDSVVLNVAPYIEKLFPKSYIDAEVGRQMWDVDQVIKNLEKQNQLGDILVFTLGTNGAFRISQLQEVVNRLEHVKQIVFVNTRVPRKWQNHVNRALKEVQEENPEIILVDWFEKSANHNEYFISDGVHLTREGAQVYAKMVYDSLTK